MNKVTLINTDSGKEMFADILTRSDKRIRVVVGIGSKSVPITLTRTDIRKPYVGRIGQMEFVVHA
jgi:hypothetical protein